MTHHSSNDVREAIEQVIHAEYGRVLAALSAQFNDIAAAEDALQDALIAALRQWTTNGIPRNPAAWLTAVAKRRAIDHVRRDQHHAAVPDDALDTLPAPSASGDEEFLMTDPDEAFPDERLKLMFACCHPALALEAQVALTLRTLGGLTTDEIARAFLVNEPTMAQRITRAKAKIRAAGIPFRIPDPSLLPERLDAILAVLYLIFNEGYASTHNRAHLRRNLCAESIRLARIVVDLLPDAPIRAEAEGLLALLMLHDSRRDARHDAGGGLIVMEDQNRALWDHAQIREAELLLERALKRRRPGSYQIQAAISALHAQAPTYADTDWAQIAELYSVLMSLSDSPVIALNRAIAVSMVDGAAAGMRLLRPLASALDDYYPYHVARADMLRRLHEREAASDAYDRAILLCHSPREADYLRKQRQALNDY